MNRILAGMCVVFFAISFSVVFAHPDDDHATYTEYVQLDGAVGIEKSTVTLHVPESNNLPWGFVEGKIANHVSGYPVILQFFQDGELAHFAQVDISDDGTYEYKFRVLDMDGRQRIHVFDGHYTVMIFKVVYSGQQA